MISISDLITKSWDFYRKNFKLLLPVLGIMFAISAAETIARSFWSATGSFLRVSTINFFIALPFYVAMLWITVALVELLARGVKGEKIDLENLYSIALQKLPMALLVSIIVGAAVIGGTILLVIPGIIFAVWFHFTIYNYLLEGKTKLEALKESKILVKGRWWPVFLRIVLVNLFWGLISAAIISLASTLIRLPFGDITKIAGGKLLTFQMTLAFVSDIFFTLTTPLILLGTLLLFFNLRETRSLTVAAPKE